MPGPAPKRPENRSRVPRGSSMTVLPGGLAEPKIVPPPAPAKILGSTRRAWQAFWASPLAKHTIPTDHEALRRLFRLYDQRERYLIEGSKRTVSLGSTGQLVIHPLLKEVDAIDAKILTLEDRFGLSPMSRLKLQVTLGDASRSLEELNKLLATGTTVEDDEAEDPRSVAGGRK
jgi:P27 family predicted phage terminase small subunit